MLTIDNLKEVPWVSVCDGEAEYEHNKNTIYKDRNYYVIVIKDYEAILFWSDSPLHRISFQCENYESAKVLAKQWPHACGGDDDTFNRFGFADIDYCLKKIGNKGAFLWLQADCEAVREMCARKFQYMRENYQPRVILISFSGELAGEIVQDIVRQAEMSTETVEIMPVGWLNTGRKFEEEELVSIWCDINIAG